MKEGEEGGGEGGRECMCMSLPCFLAAAMIRWEGGRDVEGRWRGRERKREEENERELMEGERE